MTTHDREKAAQQARALAGAMRDEVRDEPSDTTMEVPVHAWRKLAELLDLLAEGIEEGETT